MIERSIKQQEPYFRKNDAPESYKSDRSESPEDSCESAFSSVDNSN